MAFVVSEPLNKIYKGLNLEQGGKVHKFFTNTCRNHMDKYVPRDTGSLREVVTMTAESITYEMPYATYQYKGISPTGKELNYKTPLTGSYWDKKMVTAEGNEVIKEVQDYVNRGAK